MGRAAGSGRGQRFAGQWRLMVTVDGAGASHGLITRLDELAGRRDHQLVYSVGWDLGDRERAAIA